jgi:hypothetical protein
VGALGSDPQGHPAFFHTVTFSHFSLSLFPTRIEPMKKVARMLDSHAELILNWFTAKGKISAGMVEGQNYNVKLSLKKSYGFRTEEAVKTALYHRLGALPEPEFAHKFW